MLVLGDLIMDNMWHFFLTTVMPRREWNPHYFLFLDLSISQFQLFFDRALVFQSTYRFNRLLLLLLDRDSLCCLQPKDLL